MHSPADRIRLERVLRAVGLIALALWIANAAWPRDDRNSVLRGDALDDALPRLTVQEPVNALHVLLDTVPDAASAAWLAALRGAGVAVSWSGAAGSAMAIETFRSADPSGAVVLIASTPSAERPIVSDALGPIDTIAVAGAPASLRLASVEGDMTLRSGVHPARVEPPPGAPTAPRRIFVSGAAGWETKFAIAALEESGWSVDARVFVRPDHDVVQGGGGEARAALDTSRHAAVVLMDSAAAETMRGVDEFARSGGGVVLAGNANRARRVAGLVGWRAARRENAPLGTLPGDTTWRGLSRVEFDTMPARRAIALEIRGDKDVVVARRHYAGRVVGVGYDQTWRWRMAGGESAPADHRAWWSRIVASVATQPAVIPSGAAPLAALHQALGPPSATAYGLTRSLPSRAISSLLGFVVLASLLAEWLLRRSRGAR